MYNMVDVKKLGKKFSIDPKIKTHMIKVACENCFDKDNVTAYEKDLHDRDFLKQYFECKKCMAVVCESCLDEKENCQECGENEFQNLKPIDIYLCNVCVDETDRICPTCRYPGLQETFLFSD